MDASPFDIFSGLECPVGAFMIESLVSSWVEVYSGIMAQHSDQIYCAELVRFHERDRWLTSALTAKSTRGELAKNLLRVARRYDRTVLISQPSLGSPPLLGGTLCWHASKPRIEIRGATLAIRFAPSLALDWSPFLGPLCQFREKTEISIHGLEGGGFGATRDVAARDVV